MDPRHHHLQRIAPWGGPTPAAYSARPEGAQSAAPPPAWSAVVRHVPCQGLSRGWGEV
ncbi:BQ5605_C013g07277 [Microbotryum silenes-dioicae]|uniref:BQ5605_C013g07277 protein n=1 Tax=Microbotryum silenes-dioicae TaxID=796604 RepID=A0A2X0NUB1_9BASI|nr:BQ5605_C013g07277 [Microbotryum silenes-dioicae]